MKKFNVYLYYHGCYSVEVEAESEEQALELAEEKVEELNDIDFIKAIDLMPDGEDVYEVK